ncbi:mitochondrial import inner membrane translocase subunit Tim21-like [Xyrichtys novacula]|uniref:Mitochondrial import inner membrane translocase subunit Tim21 n=1 Tax=Xyrichtys novacula TaxID=13765 RepID=A0AAV1HCA6_XYRNO|nr:mitochondrial import inner membrane translocase subunit Tim21-like [Xyrichtys novacula]
MAYTQILGALHRSLQQTATHYSVQKCLFIHTHRTVSTVSKQVFPRRREIPGLSCFIQVQRRQGFMLDSSDRNKVSPEDRDRSVSRFQGGSPRTSTAQKVKNAGRDFTYLMVILIGLGVTGGLLYVVFQELFSSSSPNKIYGKAFNKVKLDPEVIGAFGEPIKCYGETTRRGRRQQVSHMEYLKDGRKHMQLKFYIEGSEPGLKGTVHSESKENLETGKYEFRYIFVDVDTYPRRTIVVEDNR